METALHERMDLSPDAASVRRARSFVRDQLTAWGCEPLARTAELLTSELATNVVRHAHTPYAVVVTRTLGGARVDVLDRSGDSPRLQFSDLGSSTGRGLAIVACMASEWGATPADDLEGYAKGVRFSVG